MRRKYFRVVNENRKSTKRLNEAQSDKIFRNDFGVKLDLDVLADFMDDDIREQVHVELAPCTPKEFFDRYCELDKDFAKNFNSRNPVY